MKYDILIVDDNDLVRSTFEVLLKINDISFLCAENGQVALDLLKENQVRFMISDIDMPEVNGIALAKQVRELYPDITVVAFTGSSGESLKDETEKHFHMIFHKTESMMNMIKQIKSILDEKSPAAKTPAPSC